MRYVIIKHIIPGSSDRCYPFLFSDQLLHVDVSNANRKMLAILHTGSETEVMSAGSFTPDFGAIRGARSLDILQGEANDQLSRLDDFLINTNDQTRGKL
jgi:hypothetical protein